MKTLFLKYFLFLSLFCNVTEALAGIEEQGRSDQENVEPQAKPSRYSFGLFKNPDRPRNEMWPALASFILPGFDQWWEGQNFAAASYTGYAVSGLFVIGHSGVTSSSSGSQIDSRDNSSRTALLGGQMYQAAGSMSAYHSFRSAAYTRQPIGEYTFLRHEELAPDLVAAPFHFSYVTQKTTWIPLVLAGGLAVATLSSGDSNRARQFDKSDAFFATTLSYQAGVNEEALFRGWFMPVFQQTFHSEFWSNSAQALMFSLAHISSSNPVPWPQLALGWYLGWLSQSNDWRLSEGVFIHAWWDVIAFTATYLDQPARAILYLPLADLTF